MVRVDVGVKMINVSMIFVEHYETLWVEQAHGSD